MQPNRRDYLKVVGAGGVGLLAGCTSGGSGSGDDDGSGSGSGDDDGSGSGSGDDGSEYPSGEITLIVPYGTGGGTDTYAQKIVDLLSDELGVEVSRDHHPGSAGAVGSRFFQQNGDDHTMLIGNMPHFVFAQFNTDNPGFDVREWTTLPTYTSEAFVLLQNPQRGDNDIDTVIEEYQSGEYTTFGGVQPGTNLSMCNYLMKDRWGFDFSDYVVYAGGGEMISSALNNEVAVSSPGLSPSTQHIEEGNANAVMQLTEEEPHPATPEDADIPTIADTGLESLDGLGTFSRHFFGHPDMSDSQKQVIEDALMTVLNSDEAQSWAEESNNPLFPEESSSTADVVEQAFSIEDQIKNFQSDAEALLNE